MQFDSISAFFDMGGYAFFVWLSYGVSALLLILLVYTSYNNHKKIKIKIAQRLLRENKLRKAAKKQSANTKHTDSENSVVENSSKNTNEAVS
jgi:heme exporter protein D